MQLSLRDKFRRPVLQTFRDHLSATEYESFSKDFNRKGNRLSMKIMEDHTQFSGSVWHCFSGSVGHCESATALSTLHGRCRASRRTLMFQHMQMKRKCQ